MLRGNGKRHDVAKEFWSYLFNKRKERIMFSSTQIKWNAMVAWNKRSNGMNERMMERCRWRIICMPKRITVSTMPCEQASEIFLRCMWCIRVTLRNIRTLYTKGSRFCIFYLSSSESLRDWELRVGDWCMKHIMLFPQTTQYIPYLIHYWDFHERMLYLRFICFTSDFSQISFVLCWLATTWNESFGGRKNEKSGSMKYAKA